MFRSIRAKLVSFIVIIFSLIVIIFSSIMGMNMYQTTIETLNKTMIQTAQLASKSITNRIDILNALLTEMSSSPVFIGDNPSSDAQTKFIADKNQAYRSSYG